ncbi:PAS domain S-box protein [bacterium]|nr:PAS domain S-box protein [bacterium]MBU1754596.1 PAS domain S-box protein [bacterium]
MNKNNQPILDNLSLVYELSLSIGKSLDLAANCEGFLKTIMSRKNLSYGAVWIKNKYLPDETDENWATLVYAHPLARAGERRISIDHPIFSLLKGKEVFLISSAEDNFAQLLVSEKGITEGGLLIFALGEIGVLKLFYPAKILEEEINQLKTLIHKFYISIKGCLSHQQTLRDIAKHRLMEEELRQHRDHLEKLVEERTNKLQESESKYRNLVERANDGICIIQDTLLKYLNPQLARIIGYSLEEIINTPFIDYIHPDELARCIDNYKRRMAGEEFPSIYESTLKHKDGQRIKAEFNAGSITYEGRPADLVFVRDITHRKQMEEKIINAEKLAAAVQIASEAVHEVKNPLAVIKSGLYYLGRILPENEEAQKTILQMDNATQRAVVYINDLLDFSKPSVLVLKQVDVHKVIEDSINELPQEMLAGIEIEKDFAPDVPLLTADPDQLKQVFVNLIKNAAEAMEGKGKLKIKSEKLKIRKEEIVQISISDTGRGVAEEDLKRIFDPFFTTKGKGTGLGLAICQRIIEAHKGGIEVESEVNKGTTFVVKLPNCGEKE